VGFRQVWVIPGDPAVMVNVMAAVAEPQVTLLPMSLVAVLPANEVMHLEWSTPI
jgi:hypothetical protein